jgi:hypothetical protein
MRKILIAFGLIWVFVWCGAGFYLGSQHMPHIQEMERLAQEGNLEEFWSTMNNWNLHASSHSHALGFTTLLILVALVMPDMRFSDRAKEVLGTLLIVGVVLSTIFGWVLFLPLVLLGEILVVAMVLMSFIGIMRGLRETGEAA